MSKFGELIDDKLPLLLVFYNENEEVSTGMHPILKDVAAAIEIGRASCRERV